MLQSTDFQYEENEKECYFSFQNHTTKETIQVFRNHQELFWLGRYIQQELLFIIPVFSSECETDMLERVCNWYNSGKPERTFEPLCPIATNVSPFLQHIRNKRGEYIFDNALRIQSYLNAPSTERWEDIHSLVVNGEDTLWQVMVQNDCLFPRTGRKYDIHGNVIEDWANIPSKVRLIRVIHGSVEKEKKKVG